MEDPRAIEHDASTAQGHQRGAQRDSMFLQAELTHRVSGRRVTVRVRNLSAGGMMADGASGFLRGDEVEVELRNVGVVKGQVAWTADEKFGVAFETQIDPIVARKPVGTGRAAPGRVR